jgi:hypothetical protein
MSIPDLYHCLTEKGYHNYRIEDVHTEWPKSTSILWVLEMDRLRVYKTLFGDEWDVHLAYAQDFYRQGKVDSTIEFLLMHADMLSKDDPPCGH